MAVAGALYGAPRDGDSSIRPEALSELGALGVNIEGLSQGDAGGEEDLQIEVEPENWPAVRLFNAMATQWRVVTLSTMRGAVLSYTGIDYNPLPALAAGLRIEITPQLLDDFKVLEVEAKRLLNRRARQALERPAS